METVRRFNINFIVLWPLLEADRKDQLPDLLRCVFADDYIAYWHLPAIITAEEANHTGATTTQQSDELFKIVSLNIICLPKEKAISVTDLQQVVSVDDWPM